MYTCCGLAQTCFFPSATGVKKKGEYASVIIIEITLLGHKCITDASTCHNLA